MAESGYTFFSIFSGLYCVVTLCLFVVFHTVHLNDVAAGQLSSFANVFPVMNTITRTNQSRTFSYDLPLLYDFIISRKMAFEKR